MCVLLGAALRALRATLALALTRGRPNMSFGRLRASSKIFGVVPSTIRYFMVYRGPAYDVRERKLGQRCATVYHLLASCVCIGWGRGGRVA